MKGIVASGHELVSEAAAEILRAGGNAFDAAVAAGFVSAVAEPALTSLGGGGFLLARPRGEACVVFDFFVDTPGRGRGGGELAPRLHPITVRFPASEQIFYAGLGSVATPGNLAGYLHVHGRLGRLPLTEVLGPAIELARGGVALNARQAEFLGLLRPIMTLTAGARRVYEPGGRYVEEGDRFANPDLAAFLETLPADGTRALYADELADRVERDMRDGEGLLTAEDLRSYRVHEREPLRVRYRGTEVWTNPRPSLGGSLLALSLQLLEGTEVGAMGHGSERHLKTLAVLMAEVDALRDKGILGPGDLAAPDAATTRERVRLASGGTTHVSVWDGDGNLASMSTSNGEGSGYVVPGTGIMLNNMMGEDDLHPEGFHASPPGERVASMMSPTVVFEDGNACLVVGSGGSKRIRTALLQVICNFVDFGMDVGAAIEAPRVHWDGTCLQAEPGHGREALDAVAESRAVNAWPVRNVYFGGVHGVAPPDHGAGDPRRGGRCVVVD